MCFADLYVYLLHEYGMRFGKGMPLYIRLSLYSRYMENVKPDYYDEETDCYFFYAGLRGRRLMGAD